MLYITKSLSNTQITHECIMSHVVLTRLTVYDCKSIIETDRDRDRERERERERERSMCMCVCVCVCVCVLCCQWTEKLVVFLLGVVQHQVADMSWHNLGVDQGFLEAMAQVNRHHDYHHHHHQHQQDVHRRGVDPGSWGSSPLKICMRGQSMFLPLNMSHAFKTAVV